MNGCRIISRALLGIDENDEGKEEDKELVLLLKVDVPHAENHARLARRCKQCTELQMQTNRTHYLLIRLFYL